MSTATIKSPYPYFGGKSSVADEVWKRFGNVVNLVEPFFGSGAILLGRPQPFSGVETINDLNGYVANFWRAVAADPDTVAQYADAPVNECDLMAWHLWLVERRESLVDRLCADPDYYDAKIAGRWCWGACCWIGSGWCSGEGPWHREKRDDGSWQLVHLGTAGQGVNRQRVHLGNAGRGEEQEACGVSRKRPLITNDAVGVAGKSGVREWMQELSDRLRHVRVCCGDWSRVCGPTPTIKQGLTAVFLDPPYSATDRADVYGHTETRGLRDDVQAWCKEWEKHPQMRIALCGYADEYDLPGWECFAWKARGGFGSQRADGTNENAKRERIWFSPACAKPLHTQDDLFSKNSPCASAPNQLH